MPDSGNCLSQDTAGFFLKGRVGRGPATSRVVYRIDIDIQKLGERS
jgi:hypothetical protein